MTNDKVAATFHGGTQPPTEPTAEPCVHGVFGPHWVGRDGDTPEWECRQPTAERAGDADDTAAVTLTAAERAALLDGHKPEGMTSERDRIALACEQIVAARLAARPAAVPDRDENLRAAIEAVLAEPDDTQWWPVEPYMDPHDDDEVTEVQVINADRLRAVLGDSGALAEHDAKVLDEVDRLARDWQVLVVDSEHDPGCPGGGDYCSSHCPVPVQRFLGEDEVRAELTRLAADTGATT